MSESAFREILGEAIKSELAEFDNVPVHKFSLKHRLAMKRIFAKFERNASKMKKEAKAEEGQKVEYKPRVSLRQRLIVALLIFILLSFLVGWVVVFVSDKFHGTVYSDNTQLTAVDIENSPNKIEYKYVLAFVPDGFEMIETEYSSIDAYTRYKNKSTGQGITLRQWVKSEFKPHYNTEHHHFEEITINGNAGLYIDFSSAAYCQTLLVWDNEDYILEIVADLNKTDTENLAVFNKN